MWKCLGFGLVRWIDAMKASKRTKRITGESPQSPTRRIIASQDARNKWEKYRKRLLVLRSHLLAERRNHAINSLAASESFSMSMADAATDEFDYDLALSLLSAEQAAIYEIDEALARIENGTYGICETTGEPIPEARLNAVPWTRFSAEVERRPDHQNELAQ